MLKAKKTLFWVQTKNELQLRCTTFLVGEISNSQHNSLRKLLRSSLLPLKGLSECKLRYHIKT